MTPIIARESRLLIRYFVVMNFMTEDFRRIDNCKNLFFLHIRIYYPDLDTTGPAFAAVLGRKGEGSLQCRKHIRHTRRNTSAAYRAGTLAAPGSGAGARVRAVGQRDPQMNQARRTR